MSRTSQTEVDEMLSAYNQKCVGTEVRSYVRGFGRVNHGREETTFRPMEGVDVMEYGNILFASRVFSNEPVYLGLKKEGRKYIIASREEMVQVWPKKQAVKEEEEEVMLEIQRNVQLLCCDIMNEVTLKKGKLIAKNGSGKMVQSLKREVKKTATKEEIDVLQEMGLI